MGLLLYAVLLFFGARGMPLKRAAMFCLVTAALLTILAIAAIDDLPTCEGVGCDRSAGTLAAAFLTNLALAFGSFGIGALGRLALSKFKRA
jgi:hypothetical protein